MTLNDQNQVSTSTSQPCKGGQDSIKNTKADLLLQTVEDRVDIYRSALIKSKKSLKATQVKVLSSIYRLRIWFKQNPEEKSKFYKHHGIKRHHFAKYECQPLVKHIIGSQKRFSDIANKQTVWSGIINLAEQQKIDPDGFSHFISIYKGGFNQAYRDALKQLPDSIYKLNRQYDIRIATKVYNQNVSPLLIETGEFKSRMSKGKNLIIVELTEEGDCSIVAALEGDPSRVDDMFDKHVLTVNHK